MKFNSKLHLIFFEYMVKVRLFFSLLFFFLSFNIKGQKNLQCVSNDSIVMRVVPCVLGTSSDFICVDIFNNSDFRISCGTYYDFQQFRFNKWVDIDFGDMAWEAGIYYINRKRNRVLKCYLNKEKYKYTPGKYRVIKYITIEKEIYEKRKVVADFILK